MDVEENEDGGVRVVERAATATAYLLTYGFTLFGLASVYGLAGGPEGLMPLVALVGAVVIVYRKVITDRFEEWKAIRQLRKDLEQEVAEDGQR